MGYPPSLVSIVLVTFNQLELTRRCLESIQRCTPESHEIIFVDNGSTDGTNRWLEQTVRTNNRYRMIHNRKRHGFSRSCNQGLALATGDYLLLLDSGAVLTSGWLSGMLESAAWPENGVIGPMTNDTCGIQHIADFSRGSLPELESFTGEFRAAHRFRRIYARSIAGFCMLFSRGLFEQAGSLDELFSGSNYALDDFCLRVELEGYRNVIAGDVFIRCDSTGSRSNVSGLPRENSADYRHYFEKWSRPVTYRTLAQKIVVLKTLEEAERLKRHGKSNDAVDLLLKTGIAQVPDEPRFYKAIAEILQEGGMASDALDTLAHCPGIEINPALLVVKTCCLIDVNRISEARNVWLQLLRYDGYKAYSALLQGRIASAESNVPSAQDAFEAALTADPSLPDVYAAIGAFAENFQQHTHAYEMYSKAADMSAGGNSESVKGLHRLAVVSNNRDRAIEVLQGIVPFRNDDKALLFMLTDLYLQAGNIKEALALAERALVQFGMDNGLVQAALSLRRQIGPLVATPMAKREGRVVSLCMIVKDEAKNLPRCLASLKPVVDEIIIADTGSSDSTREIAEVFGARVIEYGWSGDFSAARNSTLDAACGDWILVMDADEVMSDLDHDTFRKLIDESRGKHIAYSVLTRNYINQLYIEQWQANDGKYPADEAGRGWMPSDKVRIFPNTPQIHFENEIHEMVEPVLTRLGFPRKKTAAFLVHHYGHLDDDRQTRKKEIYYELGKKKLEASGGSPTALVELAIQANEANRSEEALVLWQRALKHDPRSWLAHFNLGSTLIRLGRIEEALCATRKAVELRNNYREALANLGYCHALLGYTGEALAVLLPASRRFSDYPILLLMLAVAYCCKGDYQEGESCFARLVATNVVCDEFLKKTIGILEGYGGKEKEIAALKICAKGAGISINPFS